MKSTEKKPVITRRNLCLGVGGTAVLVALGGVKLAGSEKLVRPPGGQDENRLLSACIRCEKCFEVCPHSVIAPAHLEDGFVSMRTPVMDFDDAWCDWCAEANDGNPLCVECCPTEALLLPEGATEEGTILGKAVIIEDWCLAYRLTGCRFCYEACPFEAIELDENAFPHIVPDKCNGCGACESVCVSQRDASISSGATSRAVIVVPATEA